MPTPTYVAIAKTVLTTNQSSISFASIPQTYTDLLLTCSARDTGSVAYIITQVNSLNSGFSETDLRGTGTTADSIRASGDSRFFAQGYLRIPNSGSTSSAFSSVEIYFANYSGSTNKVASATGVNESNVSVVNYLTLAAGLLQNTATITSLTITGDTAFTSGSRFDLYGIKNT